MAQIRTTSKTFRYTIPKDSRFLEWAWYNIPICNKDKKEIIKLWDNECHNEKPITVVEDRQLDEMLIHYEEEIERQKRVIYTQICQKNVLPHNEEFLVATCAYVIDVYYPGQFIEGGRNALFDKDSKKRARIRAVYPNWDRCLMNCFCWHFRLPIENPERYGTTNPAQIQRLREDYHTLTLIMPNTYYDIVEEKTEMEHCWIYKRTQESIDWAAKHILRDKEIKECTDPIDTTIWDIDDLPSAFEDSCVIGPFAYETREKADQEQKLRML